jgi:NAD+ synthase (glutamine-hydrolysing)
MKDGFLKVACYTPESKVADVAFNTAEIIRGIKKAGEDGARIIVFPELCLTCYTAGDLFYHETLLFAAENGLLEIEKATKNRGALIFVGLPLRVDNKLFNVAAALSDGKLLGFVPKTYLPNYNEFYEKRQFSAAEKDVRDIDFHGETVPFGTDIIFEAHGFPGLKVAAELCEDLWVMSPPSARHAAAGATVVVNLSASNELAAKADYRRSLVSMQSAKLFAAYIYADAGAGESTTDMVFAGHDIIAENGKILAESKIFSYGETSAVIDFSMLCAERTKYAGYNVRNGGYRVVEFYPEAVETRLSRVFPRFPFVPSGENERSERAEFILSLQAHALSKRLAHTNASGAVIGISGGLDSALALLACVRAKELLPEPQKSKFKIMGITMPCFGTTKRTLVNAKKLISCLGAEYVKISIKTSVNRHLADIRHAENTYDVTYENAQARERTQVLMDYANKTNGLVVGTGDLSELALGWATYNGDHMSMYAVNCSVPKTLVKYLVGYEAERLGGGAGATLKDILDTPISPELLPSDGKEMTQITEDKVGPYELHDFFLYYFMRYAFPPKKIYRIACVAFSGIYTEETVLKWLTVFIKRFFAQQFKRSCIPDGVKIGSVSLSPRADWRMPSDAVAKVWLDELAKIPADGGTRA